MLSLIFSNIISIIIFYITTYYIIHSPLLFMVILPIVELLQVAFTQYMRMVVITSFGDKLNAVIIYCATYIIYFFILKKYMNSMLYPLIMLYVIIELQVYIGRYIGLYKF